MHVSALVHAYLPTHMAGAETTMHDLLKELVSVGWTAEVALTRPETEHLGIEPYELDGVVVKPWTSKNDAIRAVGHSDLVITHLESSERAVLLGRQFNVPVAHLVHNTMWQTEGYLHLGCDLAIYNTQWVADHHMGVADTGIAAVQTIGVTRYVPSVPLDAPYTVLHPLVNAADYQVEGPHDHVTLVNLWQNKGPDVFYELARRFPEQKFLGVKGGYGVQDVRDLPNVEIIENTPRIAEEVYSRTKVLLMPSKYESFGRVAVEAAASGIPTIANPTPGLQEALGRDGLYAPLEDLDCWEYQIRRLTEPEGYSAAQAAAKARSDFWMEKRPKELQEFVDVATYVAEEKRSERALTAL